MNKKRENSEGQIILIVLLTMVVALTIALGIFSSSLVDTSQTVSQEKSERAFSLAESRVENLLTGRGVEVEAPEGFSVTSETKDRKYVNNYVKKNAVVSIDLNDDIDRVVEIYWSLSGDEEQNPEDLDCSNIDKVPAGLIIQKWTDNGGNIEVSNMAYRPYVCVIVEGSENFERSESGEQVDVGGETKQFANKITINTSGNDLVLRVRPVFNDATIFARVSLGETELPVQQTEYKSSAQADETNESRKIVVVKTNPDLPEIFDYALFSAETLAQ